MQLTPSTPQIRDPKSIRKRVDAKLGQGSGMTFAKAREILSPVERVEWSMGEFLFSMLDRRFHIWVQGWCLEGPVDGPAAIAAIAEVARPLDGVMADMLRWSARRGVWARTGRRKEALFNVVPEIWHGAWHRVVPFMDALMTRWPEDLDPFELPAPKPWKRSTRFVKPHLVFKDAESVAEITAHALWAAGASEDDLDAFFWASGKNLAKAVSSRVKCDAKALKALLNPPDLLAEALGVKEIKLPSVHVVPPKRETEILEAATRWNHVVVKAPFKAGVQSALRQDPDLIIGWTSDLAADDAALVTQILQTGPAMLFFGTRGDLAGVPKQYFQK